MDKNLSTISGYPKGSKKDLLFEDVLYAIDADLSTDAEWDVIREAVEDVFSPKYNDMYSEDESLSLDACHYVESKLGLC